MLHFLSSLFSGTGSAQGQVNNQLIEAAIERAVDGTDQRLRALGYYRKRLRPVVESAVAHITNIVDALPAAIEISPDAFRTNSLLRAFFVSPAHMQDVISNYPAVKTFLKQHGKPLPTSIYGCLSMDYREKKVLGMEMKGETLQRDVAQVTVNFTDHRFVGPSDNELSTRQELENRGFDFMIEKALESMISTGEKRIELEQQRRILERKLDAMRAGQWGMEEILSPGELPTGNPEELELEIEQLDRELLALGSVPTDLEQRLAMLTDMLGQTPEWLGLDTVTMSLDAMLIKRTEADSRASTLRFTRVRAMSGEQRIIMLGYFPTAELPESVDFFKEAQRYLG